MPELVYDFAFQSVLRAIDQARVSEVEAAWREAGVDSHRWLPAYPRALWEQAVDLAAQVMPGATRELRHHQLGAEVPQGYARTTLGRVLAPAARLIGPMRVMQRSERNFSITNNFMRVRLERLERHHATIALSHATPSPEFLAGSTEGIARYAGATEVRARAVCTPDGGLVLHVDFR